MIEFGTKVKDRLTGLVGKVRSRTEHSNGCIQYGVTKPFEKGDTEFHTWNIDEQDLEVIEKPKPRRKPKPKKRTGGAPTKL